MTQQAASELRARIVEEAKSWLRTPFHHRQALKGIGADCGTFIVSVYKAVGICEVELQMPPYSPDWFLHATDDRYVAPIIARSVIVEAPLPGDTVLFRLGKANATGDRPYAHGGIVIEDPSIIHARWKGCVEYEDRTQCALIRMPATFFRPKVLMDE